MKKNYSTTPTLSMLLDLVRNVSLLGLLICANLIIFDRTVFSPVEITVYSIWFMVSLLSLRLMKRGDRWGAYALALATMLVTVFDGMQGHITLGGAILGISVLMIVIVYIFTQPSPSEQTDLITTSQ